MKFETIHKDVLKVCPNLKQYRSLDERGRVLEAWDKNDDGVYKDVTLREQERQRADEELVKAKRELNKLTGEQNV